ncbi:unnamed protein product [Ectocarpus sp. CCAP 1310/34]|nr:unnamed protein product [Ectocarpus sp. CCAP 1310/34]
MSKSKMVWSTRTAISLSWGHKATRPKKTISMTLSKISCPEISRPSSWTDSSLGSEADVFFAAATDSNNGIILGGRTEGYWSSSTPELCLVWPSTAKTTASCSGQTSGCLVYGEGDAGDCDFFATKLDGTDGSEIWTTQGGASTSFDSFREVVVESTGDLVAVGISGDVYAISIFVVKLSGIDGIVLWEYSPVTSLTHDVPHSVDVDAQDDVNVVGVYDALNLQGSTAETPVVLKLDGATGDVGWTYEGMATSGDGFYDLAVDLTTGWVVGAGWTEGTWVTGAAQGGYDVAAVLLDGVTGNELGRYQNGTTDDDYLAFAGFDSAGGFSRGDPGRMPAKMSSSRSSSNLLRMGHLPRPIGPYCRPNARANNRSKGHRLGSHYDCFPSSPVGRRWISYTSSGRSW